MLNENYLNQAIEKIKLEELLKELQKSKPLFFPDFKLIHGMLFPIFLYSIMLRKYFD